MSKDAFKEAESAVYRSDYKRIVMNALSTFKKLNRVAAIDMNSAISAAMEGAMDQTSAVLEVSDEEVIELMEKLSVTKNRTNDVLNRDMNLHKILKEKLGGEVIDDKMIESLLDTIASKFEKFQTSKNAMVISNNSDYVNIEARALADIKKKVGIITDYDRLATERYNMSWAKKVASADISVSTPVMQKLGKHKTNFMIGFHVVSVLSIIAIKRSFNNRRKVKNDKT